MTATKERKDNLVTLNTRLDEATNKRLDEIHVKLEEKALEGIDTSLLCFVKVSKQGVLQHIINEYYDKLFKKPAEPIKDKKNEQRATKPNNA